MDHSSPRAVSRTIHTVALAYFSRPSGVSDSVRDLCTAGFAASHINISQSVAQQKTSPLSSPLSPLPDAPLPNAIGTHSRRWQLSRLLSHDRHRSGADQIGGRNRLPSEGDNPTCSTFDLHLALSAMQVPEVVIQLLQQDVQKKGVFILVDAAHRVSEADRILDGNAGYLRTQYLSVLPS